jgi:hypothetical protein
MAIGACVILAASCANPAADDPQDEPDTGKNVRTIRGAATATAQDDSQETVVFEFTVPEESVVRATRSRSLAAGWVSVSGKARAGDILLDLEGTYNESTKDVILQAQGNLLGTLIEVIIRGIHDVPTDRIVDADVGIIVTAEGEEPTQYFSDSVSKTSESPSAGASQTAAPIAAKSWYGTWSGSYESYVAYDEETETLRTYPGPGEGRTVMSTEFVATLTASYFDVVSVSTYEGVEAEFTDRKYYRIAAETATTAELHLAPFTDEIPSERFRMTVSGNGLSVENFYVPTGPYGTIQSILEEVLDDRDFEAYPTLPEGWNDPRNWTETISLGTMTKVE